MRVKGIKEYINKEENDYIYKKSVNGVDYSLLYRPTDLLVKQELPENYVTKDVDSLRAKYSKYLYFNLSMSKNDDHIVRAETGRDRVLSRLTGE